MQIDEEQLKYLDKFECVRLSSEPENKELISNFENKRNKAIVDYLKKRAWDDDINGRNACYIIKSPNDEIVLYFAIKCGALFTPFDEEELNRIQDELKQILKNDGPLDKDNAARREQVISWIESFRTGNLDITPALLVHTSLLVKTKLKALNIDKNSETNKKIVRVTSTHPAIELTHICINESYKPKWDFSLMQHNIGEVMFWKHIASIILDIQTKLGCQYVFLFAADLTENGCLINYYDVTLKFKQDDEIATNKPYYDFCCTFMCQEICDLRNNQQDFFKNFNKDQKHEVIA